jgi:hypothetical protein
MSNEQKKDWFIELGLVERKAEILKWGMKKYPHYAKNENMMAQMWWTQHEKKVLPETKTITTIAELRKRVKEFIDAGDIVDENGKPRKAWGNIEVLVVGPLGDSKPYFGCEKCTRGIDKNVGVCVNDDSTYGHPGEQIEGKMISWQNWQVGDTTDEAIISFAPNNKQSPHQIQGRVLVLEGSMNVRDGRYSVWGIISNKAAANLGGSGVNIDLTLPEEIPEQQQDSVVEEPEEVVEEVVIDAETTDEDVPDSAEEFIDEAEFFADAVETETGSEEGLRAVIKDYDGLLKLFERSIEKHVGTKKVPAENMRRFLLVRPQIRELDNPAEIAKQFLEEMVALNLVAIDKEDYLTRV